MPHPAPRLFVAGATGVVGAEVVARARTAGISVTPHLRPRRAAGNPLGADPAAAVFDLDDHARLVEAMRGHTAVLQLIGTMRKRFKQGDTYETSDIGTTRLLVAAAREAGVPHVVALTSVGAGRPVGTYLKAKAEVERIVTGSGLRHDFFRPSSFIGGPHRPPPGMAAALNAAAAAGLRGTAARFRPIPVPDLARSILLAAVEPGDGDRIFEGVTLWAQVDAARRRFGAS